MSGIVDPYLKLTRAKKHLDDLDAELAAFKASAKGYRIERADDVENQCHVIKVWLLDAPDQLSLVAGDAFFCMRSALDQLVWSLAKLTVSTPQRTQFPILSEPASSQKEFRRGLGGVPEDAIHEIEALQPHHRGAAFSRHPLWRLNTLCNIDKHRRIPVNGSELMVNFDRSVRREDVQCHTTDDHHVMSIPLSMKDRVAVNPSVTFKVNFGQGNPEDPADTDSVSESREGIWEIYNFVGEIVLPRFARFFS